MKKLLLLLVAACFILGANAQKATDAVKMNQKKSLLDSEYQRTPITPGEINYSLEKKVTSIDKIDVGTAHSQRSFRREDCKVISYNKDLNLISMSFIIDEETYPDIALSDGSVGIFYSTDLGLTWSGPVLLSDLTSEDLRNYYLSGVLYNPSGNTVVENAYGVYQGVAPEPTLTDWNNQAFGSSTLGGANYFTEFFVNEEPDHAHDGYFNQLGLAQKADIMKCFNIWAEGPWAGFTTLQMEDIHGTFTGTGFDWDIEHSIIYMPFNNDPTDNNSAMWIGKWTFADVGAEMAWSDDGMTGYAWMLGAHEDMQTGWWPIMFKTTNGGDSWDEITLDFFDDDIQDVFRNEATDPLGWLIFPCQDINEEYKDFAIPYFKASAGAVDAEGNLQLFATVKSHSRDFINEWEYYEGIGWVYNLAETLFKFTIGDELIDGMMVDTCMSNAAQDLTSGANDSLYCGTNAWLHRLQVTKDERSEEFFVTWTDTEEGDRVVENLEPDIRGWSYNITTGEHTDAFCFTCGTTFPFEHYWYVQAADEAYYDALTETFTIPMVNAVSLNDFYSNSSASGDPIDVQYITGITFDAIVPIPVSVDEIAGPSNLSVSQNLPNPASVKTTIEISSETIAAVTVEVSNIVGQTVRTIDAGIINGDMSVTIDVSDLEAGVYLYSVTIGNERVSKRMLVR